MTRLLCLLLLCAFPIQESLAANATKVFPERLKLQTIRNLIQRKVTGFQGPHLDEALSVFEHQIKGQTLKAGSRVDRLEVPFQVIDDYFQSDSSKKSKTPSNPGLESIKLVYTLQKKAPKGVPPVRYILDYTPENPGHDTLVIGNGVYTISERGITTQLKPGVKAAKNVVLLTCEGCYVGAVRRDGEHLVQHGAGKMFFANGDVYEGTWLEGQQHGKGVMKYHTGEAYDGEWVQGRRQGKRTLTDRRLKLEVEFNGDQLKVLKLSYPRLNLDGLEWKQKGRLLSTSFKAFSGKVFYVATDGTSLEYRVFPEVKFVTPPEPMRGKDGEVLRDVNGRIQVERKMKKFIF